MHACAIVRWQRKRLTWRATSAASCGSCRWGILTPRWQLASTAGLWVSLSDSGDPSSHALCAVSISQEAYAAIKHLIDQGILPCR